MFLLGFITESIPVMLGKHFVSGTGLTEAMSRSLLVAAILAGGIVGGGMWVASRIEPVRESGTERAEQQVTFLEQTAKKSNIELDKTHDQLVVEEVKHQAQFNRRMNEIRRMGDEVEDLEARQTQARLARQCAAGLTRAC